MTAPIDEWTQDIHQGDAAETLREMPESSVHMAMCSPPYFGLRDYGIDGQIGLEDSLSEYIDELVGVGEELRRVLRPDGCWWLNLGDTYSGGSIVRTDGEWTRPGEEGYEEAHTATTDSKGRRSVSPLGRKNKMLVPHRTAIALQEAGWIVRNDVVWAKPNPMPESVTDRLSTTFEFVFHLTPARDYWYDLDAIREPLSEYSRRVVESDWRRRDNGNWSSGGPGNHTLNDAGDRRTDKYNPAGKNPGDIFEVSVKGFPDAHFAVYPTELCKKPIKSSCPPQVCAECGTPYTRTRDVKGREVGGGVSRVPEDERGYGNRQGQSQNDREGLTQPTEVELSEWTADCDCDTEETEPGIVLDPFAGAGTTCLVAKELGRRFVGIELNPEYVAMAQRRAGVTVDDPGLLLDDVDTHLGAFAEEGEGPP